MSEENDLFLKQMKGVTEIKKKNKVTNTKIIKKKKLKKNIINSSKGSSTEKRTTSIIKNSNFSLEKVSIKKNIKKNILKIDRKIDFHGKSLLEAEGIFSSTIINR